MAIEQQSVTTTLSAPDVTSLARDRGALSELARQLKRHLDHDGSTPSDQAVALAQEALPKARQWALRVAAVFANVKNDAFKWHRRLTSMEHECSEPAPEVSRLAKDILGRHALAERKRLLDEAKQREQELAIAAEGDPDFAEVPIAVKPEKVQIDGAAVRFKREAKIVDLGQFLSWVARDGHLLLFDEARIKEAFDTALDRLVDKNRELEIPGVVTTIAPAVSARGGIE